MSRQTLWRDTFATDCVCTYLSPPFSLSPCVAFSSPPSLPFLSFLHFSFLSFSFSFSLFLPFFCFSFFLSPRAVVICFGPSGLFVLSSFFLFPSLYVFVATTEDTPFALDICLFAAFFSFISCISITSYFFYFSSEHDNVPGL